MTEPDLILTDDRDLIDGSRTGNNESIGYMGLLSTLLSWHAADPVDAIERQHHEAVFAAQGNRNPFIDHPEWVTCVFQSQCKVLVANPAGLAGLWFDPALDGEGFNLIVSDIGTIIYFYGYSASGDRLWLISALYDGDWTFNEAVSLTLFEARGGSFEQPALPADALLEWGTLDLLFSDCENGQFTLSGNDGDKISTVTQLVGISGTDCGGQTVR